MADDTEPASRGAAQKVLLLSPKTSFGPKLQRTYAGGLGTVNPGERNVLPPLDLLRIAGVLRAAGSVPRIVDEEVEGSLPEVEGALPPLADARQGRAEADIVICQVSLAAMREDVRRLGEFAAAGLRTFAYTSIRGHDQWQEILTTSGCEAVILPEAIPRLGYLVEARAAGAMAIPGLITAAAAHDPGRLPHVYGDLADEPLPARDLVDHRRYVFPALPAERITTMNASFGCPYPCGFYCPYPLGEGKKVRAYPVERIAAEFEQCARLGITAVVFRDPVFTFDRRRTLALCEAVKRTGTGIRWWCETRIDRLDEELIRVMVDAGCVGVEVGVESGDARMHDTAVRKRLGLDTVRAFHRTARQTGLNMLFLLLFGLPGETRQSIANTLEFILELGLSSEEFNVGVITPYPGTALHELALDKGWIRRDQDRFTSFNVVMRTDELTENDLTEALALTEELHRIDGGCAPADTLASYRSRIRNWADTTPAPHGRSAAC
ncbi:AprD4 family radical SAM diol-dehydratase [Streptomyces sp. NPDC048696]|uniref:AprD4 family radical SAM diol-dehydratase n=1 Tax=Streptomyces sp. NPDC048696 TaxID=3365585 RepID=UPI003717769E